MLEGGGGGGGEGGWVGAIVIVILILIFRFPYKIWEWHLLLQKLNLLSLETPTSILPHHAHYVPTLNQVSYNQCCNDYIFFCDKKVTSYSYKVKSVI